MQRLFIALAAFLATATLAFLPTGARAQLGLLGVGLGGVAAAGGSFTPATILAKIPHWYDVSDPTQVVRSGTSLTGLNDKGSSPSNSTGTQTWVSADLNGLDVAQFSGTGGLTSGSVTTNPSATLTVLAVVKNTNAASNYYDIFDTGNAAAAGVGIAVAGSIANDWLTNDLIAVGNGSNNSQNPRAIAHPAPISFPDTAYHIIRVDLGAISDVYGDGTASTLSVQTTAAWTSVTATMLLGSGWSGKIAEWIVAYDLSTSGTPEAQKLEGYLACKYALQSQLPIGHPFKSTCP